jgi:hypothetical protein
MQGVPVLRKVARRLTVQQFGASRTSDELATAVVAIFTTLLATLSPLLGQSGSLALFRRSIRLSESIVPFYAELRAAEQDHMVKAVGTCLRGQALHDAQDAAEALLVAYLELLANFIGEQLTWQILQEAWPGLRSSLAEETEE